ncbi:transposase family protein [Thiocapsa sp.]|uniref:transposase family protein n=1 Tax=Thiocapsa sp. TaxID=2024551 RepID=UPI00345AB480
MEGTHCHRCGKPIDHGYGLGQEIKLRHLPVFDYHTVLVLRPKRYQCHSCEGRPTTSQMLSWYSPRASVTKAFEQQMLLEVDQQYARGCESQACRRCRCAAGHSGSPHRARGRLERDRDAGGHRHRRDCVEEGPSRFCRRDQCLRE